MSKKVLTPDTIMVIPVGRPGGNYRDTLPEPGRGRPPDTAFSPLYLPTTIGSLHIIVLGKKPYAPASSLRKDQKTNFAISGSRAEPIRIESFGECRVCPNCCVASRRKRSVTFYLRVRRRESHHFPTGTDTMLLSIAQAALDHAGWPSHVLTGRNMFKIGDNTRNSV